MPDSPGVPDSTHFYHSVSANAFTFLTISTMDHPHFFFTNMSAVPFQTLVVGRDVCVCVCSGEGKD